LFCNIFFIVQHIRKQIKEKSTKNNGRQETKPKKKKKKMQLVDNLIRRVHGGWRRHGNWRIRSWRRCQRWETWLVEKLSGKDAGKDTGGGAAVKHTNFAARYRWSAFFFLSGREGILGWCRVCEKDDEGKGVAESIWIESGSPRRYYDDWRVTGGGSWGMKWRWS